SLIFAFNTFDLVWIATKGGTGDSTEVLLTLAYRVAFEQFLFGKGAAILNLVFAVCFALAFLYIFTVRREERLARRGSGSTRGRCSGSSSSGCTCSRSTGW